MPKRPNRSPLHVSLSLSLAPHSDAFNQCYQCEPEGCFTWRDPVDGNGARKHLAVCAPLAFAPCVPTLFPNTAIRDW
jgi:hypothetical protein